MNRTDFRRKTSFTAVLLGLVAAFASPASPAEIEFLTGAKVQCRTISKDETTLKVEVTVGDKKYIRDYPLEKIHAVTIGEKRYVINPKAGGGGTSGGLRTREQVQALISEQGKTPPDWYETTPLNYPKSLDLSWPEPAPKGWNNQANVGQYVWDIINPNQGKWKEGTRLMHHLLQVNSDDPATRVRVMNNLGRFYHDLLEDYPRAAFWWQQAGVNEGKNTFGQSGPHLAACYFKLGNKQMAVELLSKLPPHYSNIKVWGDIGEPAKAATLADAYARGGEPSLAYIYAADAFRTAGNLTKALEYYEKVLAADPKGREKLVERNQNRARASIEAIKLFELSDVKRVPDGTYRDKSLGYEGDVEVEVAVQSGRIESVKVVRHKEKQFYSSMSDTPAKIIAKQGVKGVDTTSSATITSEAIINATAKALATAAK